MRVAGAGNTNYVVAKDDIGNWYVKSYSADPEPIIKAAKSMALFATGIGMKKNLLAGAKAGATLESSTLERQFEKHKKEYEDKSKKDFEELQRRSEGLPEEIEKAWGVTKDVYKEAMVKPKEELAKESKTLGEDKERSSGEKTLALMNAVKRFTLQTKANLDAKSAEVGKTGGEPVLKLGGALLREFRDRHEKDRERYETVLGILGEEAGE